MPSPMFRSLDRLEELRDRCVRGGFGPHGLRRPVRVDGQGLETPVPRSCSSIGRLGPTVPIPGHLATGS